MQTGLKSRRTSVDEPRTVDTRPSRVLLLSSNPAQIDMIARQAPVELMDCVPMTEIDRALAYLDEHPVDVMVVDEDLGDASGVDVLIQARTIDPYTSLVLVVDEDLGVAVACDALNQADLTKILLQPYTLEEWVQCCQDAANRYDNNVRTHRRLNLSRAKVRRLSRNIEQTKRDLAKKNKQIEIMRRAPVVPSRPEPAPPPPAPEPVPEPETPSLRGKLVALLSRIILAGPERPSIERIRRTAESCAQALRWPLREINELLLATLLHHAIIDEYPQERRAELRGSSTDHAREIADLLGALPGFSDVADIIAQHHGAPMTLDATGQPQVAPRSARLLQILSLFDEIAHDPKLLSSGEAQLDSDLGISRASDAILRLAEQGKLDLELSEQCVRVLLPRALERDERCLDTSELEVGMELSRTVYTDNLALVRSGTTLSESILGKIRLAHENQRFLGIWVVGAQAQAAA